MDQKPIFRLALAGLVLCAPLALAVFAGAQDAAQEETPAAQAEPAAQSAEPAGEAIPDDEMGLSRTSVFDTPSPPPVGPEASAPTEKPVLPRAFPGAPPRVPHGVADFLPITRSENLCIDCHLVEEKVEGEPTPIPASHKTDLRNAPGEVGEKVVGARWVCVTCHVASGATEPPVGNEFRP